MRKKNVIIAVIMVALIMVSVSGAAYAAGYACAQGGQKGQKGQKKHHMSLEKKFIMKAHMLMKNQDALGLTAKQVEKVRALKFATMKDLITRRAEIDIVSLDIKEALGQDAIDQEAIKTFIRKKYELKSEKAQSLVEPYITLKSILTDEQKKTICSLYRQHK